MPHEVETMFYTKREKPWHGLGLPVDDALSSIDALSKSGLDWSVIQKPILTDGTVIPGYKANIRSSDGKVLGVVTDRYSVVQNSEAFAFTDSLLGEGVRYETAGSLMGGKKVWLLAKLPSIYRVAGDDVETYLVFSNCHDGSNSVRVAITPVRVVCQNTLNLALIDAKRIWSTTHVGDISMKLEEAKTTLLRAEDYMDKLKNESVNLSKISISDKKLMEFIEQLIPLPEEPTRLQETNVDILRTDLKLRYMRASDLTNMPKNGWRFMNAVSDFSTHATPRRQTATFNENRFMRTIEGNPIFDRAYELVKALAK